MVTLPTLPPSARVRGATPTETEWLEAARSGVIERLEPIYAAHAAIAGARDSFGTALHWASSRDHARAVQWLLARGVPLEARGSAGHTALHVAAHFGHAEPLGALLAAGARHTAEARDGTTPLAHACAACNLTSVRVLIDAGASLFYVHPGETALHAATPLDIARRVQATAMGVARQRESGLVAKLVESSLQHLKQWFRAARMVDLQTLEAIAALGGPKPAPHIDARNGSGSTALMMSVRAGRLDGARWLLAHDADPNVADHNGWTALHHLASVAHTRHGMSSVLALLLRAGANADRRCARGPHKGKTAECLLAQLPASSPTDVAEAHEALRRALGHASRLAYLRGRWRLIGRLAILLAGWHARAVETAYAPGGGGYLHAAASFAERAAKVQRTT